MPIDENHLSNENSCGNLKVDINPNDPSAFTCTFPPGLTSQRDDKHFAHEKRKDQSDKVTALFRQEAKKDEPFHLLVRKALTANVKG